MKLVTCPKFLTRGSFELPAGVIAAAIHPSSEVDLCDVGGMHRLSVGGIVPLPQNQIVSVESVRNPLIGDQLFGTEPGNITIYDGEEEPGGKLVLQLYDKCDALMPPGGRVSYYKDIEIAEADIPATEEAAQLAMRIPFHGRAQCTVGMWRSGGTQDLSIIVVGRSYGRKGARLSNGSDFTDQGGVVYEHGTQTWWNGGAVPESSVEAGVYLWRVFHVGGLGDSAEAYDELQLFVYGGAGGGIARITAEAFGERTR